MDNSYQLKIFDSSGEIMSCASGLPPSYNVNITKQVQIENYDGKIELVVWP